MAKWEVDTGPREPLKKCPLWRKAIFFLVYYIAGGAYVYQTYIKNIPAAMAGGSAAGYGKGNDWPVITVIAVMVLAAVLLKLYYKWLVPKIERAAAEEEARLARVRRFGGGVR